MKNVLYLAFALVIAMGCTKEESKTTYTFVAKDGAIAATTDILHSSDYYNVRVDMVFSEYGAGHRLAFQRIDNAIDEKKYTFVAHPNTEYVTVRIDVTGEHDRYEDFEFIRFFGNVTFLEKGKDTEIVFDRRTMVGEKEPK